MVECDTHFQQFAELLVKEFESNDLIPEHHARLIIKERMRKIIAQRAYDLACHVVNHVSETQATYREVDYMTAQEIVADIPDMTAFPD